MTPRGREFLDRLRAEILPGDGALGSMLGAHGASEGPERLNLTNPNKVRQVHAAYAQAGAALLESNTFGANRVRLGISSTEVKTLNRLGIELARAEAKDEIFIAGAVGPLPSKNLSALYPDATDTDLCELFQEPIIALAEAGADLIMLETFTDLRQITLALQVARNHSDLPVVCQMSFQETGQTLDGVSVAEAVAKLSVLGADVIGVNCGKGVRAGVIAAREVARLTDRPVSAFLNAGLPAYIDGRYFYGAPLTYMVDAALELADAGLNLIGGCCGTTPDFTRLIAERLRARKPVARTLSVAGKVALDSTRAPVVEVREARRRPGSILEKMTTPSPVHHKPLIVVELDPPRGLNYEPILHKARQFRDLGVDALTMADNPVATLHMGNLTLADIVQRELGIPVILHMACRDSNILGLQSRLLEAHVRGVHHLLALTGDPAKVGDTPGATSVYDLNSFGLVELIRKFNQGKTYSGQSLGGQTRFTIGVAFNQNGKNLKAVIDRLQRKAAAGADYALTQPIYDLQRYDEVIKATHDLDLPIFMGIMPLLSERNAEFLHNEVPGIILSDDARKRMKGLTGKAGRTEGNKLCMDIIDHMLPTASAFYLVPPQKFTDMAIELVEHIQARIPAGVS